MSDSPNNKPKLGLPKKPKADEPTGARQRPVRPAARTGKPAPPKPRSSEPVSFGSAPSASIHKPQPAADGLVRLSKRMADLGLCSRREADTYIERGWVKVDGVTVSELGSKVRPEQTIALDAAGRASQARRVTVLINKPVGYVSGQAEDGYQPASVLVVPDNHWTGDPSGISFRREHLAGLAPAGRLDIDSVGLLVLTQDGRVARLLIGEDSNVEKEYLVRVEGRLSDRDLQRLNHGLELDGKPLKPARVWWQNQDQLRFILTEGKKRQIRRMCELVGLRVVGLKRVRIGRLMLGDLPPGQWRYLGPDETID